MPFVPSPSQCYFHWSVSLPTDQLLGLAYLPMTNGTGGEGKAEKGGVLTCLPFPSMPATVNQLRKGSQREEVS